MRAKIQQVSDTAIRVQFGTAIDPALPYILHEFVQRLRNEDYHGVTNWEYGYTTIMVHFEPWRVSGADVVAFLKLLSNKLSGVATVASERILEIPVCYGGDYGPDLADVAEYHRLDAAAVIELHTSHRYEVAFIGFAPGFPYLMGLAPTLETPRLSTPRKSVPAGSVGIGGAQTGIYPNDSPAGWRIIGRTPLRLFDYTRDPAALCRGGDVLRFVSVPPEEFERLRSLS